jgi:hypothetical protein
MFPYFSFTRINIANVSQTSTAVGQNIAIGSPGVSQTLVQIQSNSAVVHQG